jgi:hypothetical protein
MATSNVEDARQAGSRAPTERKDPAGVTLNGRLRVDLVGSLALAALVISSRPASAQDPFEIHVYEYESLPRGEYSVEAHLNATLQGTTQREGTVAPTHDQVHLTLEPTLGLGDHAALGFMFLSARRPGSEPQFAGWRILPHLYAPDSLRLPFKLGFVAEFSFQSTAFEANSRRVELRPIFEKTLGRVHLDLNPVFERALRGPDVRRGWNFEPAVLVRYERDVFSPSIEYYGEVPGITTPPRGQPQTHQVFVGGDVKVREDLGLNLGVGFNLGRNGPGLVVKSRFEWHRGPAGPR